MANLPKKSVGDKTPLLANKPLKQITATCQIEHPRRRIYCGATILVLLLAIAALTAFLISSIQQNLKLIGQINAATVQTAGFQSQVKKIAAKNTAKPAPALPQSIDAILSFRNGLYGSCGASGEQYKIEGPNIYWQDENNQTIELNGAIWYWVSDLKADPKQPLGRVFFQDLAEATAFKIPAEFKEYYRTKNYIVWTDIKTELLPKNCDVWLSLPLDFKLD